MRPFDLSAWWRLLLSGLVLASSLFGRGAPSLNEFTAANSSGLRDEDGDFSDWIEIHNPADAPVSLAGYHLTDDPNRPDKWTFPATPLGPDEYLVVFASGKNRTNAAGRLHANFKLSAAGEYLALVSPDGATVPTAFAPAYPPQFDNVSFGLSGTPPAWSYFVTPTPGGPNGTGTRAGPVLSTSTPSASSQVQTDGLRLTVSVRAVNGPVTSVNLYCRRMLGPEVVLKMTDDGTGGDALANDGTWSATIPAAAFAPGEMLRWRFVATDDAGALTKEPAFHDPLNSPQYFGIVTPDPRIRTALPVFYWFTTNLAGAGTTGGARGAVSYDGVFYDNVLFRIHGQSSTGFPKKSYNIGFNNPQPFRWRTNAPAVKKINLLSNWADKSKVRNVLAYEVMRQAGVAAHFAFTARVQENGAFFSTADLVEDGDEIYLARAGLNPEGALYKVYNNLLDKSAGNTGNSGVEKKTRQSENNSDLQALINGLAQSGSNLEKYLYDNIDIPGCVSLLAATSIIRNLDMHSKNWYIYRDTGRSGEWTMLPWDLDLSCGRVWDPQYNYFDNALYTDDCVVNSTSIRLVAQMFGNPAMRAMILRRIRTLSDRFLQPVPVPGTPESELYYERRLNEQSALIDPPENVPSDARQDFEKWGSWLQGGATVRYTNTSAVVETMTRAIQRWKTEYLPHRRSYIYGTQIVGMGGEIPLPQNAGPAYTYITLVAAGAPAQVLAPTDGALGTTWTGNPAAEPFAATGWISGRTGVGYDRGAGYGSLIGIDIGAQMRTNTSVYVRIGFDLADPAAVDHLELRMKCDDGFVAFINGTIVASANAPTLLRWNSAARTQHGASTSTDDVYDITSKKFSLMAGHNVLTIQALNDTVTSPGMVVVPELWAGAIKSESAGSQPVLSFGTIDSNPLSGNQDQEYVQLLNPNALAVDISDWRITGGIEHTFRPGTVLPANGAIYVSPNPAAFRARLISPKGGESHFVQGGYKGHLSSRGETLVLLDASGATNNTVTYPAQSRIPAFPVDPLADSNGNGDPDLVDYALGNDLGLPPLTPQLVLDRNSIGTEPALELSCPFSLSATNVTIEVFFSRDLVHWQDASSELEMVSKQPLNDGRLWITWQVAPPFQSEPHVFLRFGVVTHP